MSRSGSGNGKKAGILIGGVWLLFIVGTASGCGNTPAANVGPAAPSSTSPAPTVTASPASHPATAGTPSQPRSRRTNPATPPAPASTYYPPAPAPTIAPAAPTTHAAAPASCYPLTNGGNCYEPGEYCRKSDHGASGVAGDGKAITCEDNDGWRWEPA